MVADNRSVEERLAAAAEKATGVQQSVKKMEAQRAGPYSGSAADPPHSAANPIPWTRSKFLDVPGVVRSPPLYAQATKEPPTLTVEASGAGFAHNGTTSCAVVNSLPPLPPVGPWPDPVPGVDQLLKAIGVLGDKVVVNTSGLGRNQVQDLLDATMARLRETERAHQDVIERCNALKEENRILRMQGTHDANFLGAVAEEVKRARAKYPGNARRFTAIAEEFGEVARAIDNGEDRARLYAECVQLAGTALRLAVEGSEEHGVEALPR